MIITNSQPVFKEKVISDAIDHAKKMFPEESCGAVIDEEYIPFENKAENPEKEFLINDPGFAVAHLSDQVQAVIHSHNNYPKATSKDQEQQQEFDVPFGIINLVNRSVTHVVFFGDSVPSEPLTNREFFFGVWDCYSLVRDFIKEEYNVTAPNPPRDYGFWHKNKSVFEGFVQDGNLPFIKIDKQDAQPGDILFYQMQGSKYVNHCGVMRENGQTLHHLSHYLSKHFPTVSHWESVVSAWRYDSDWDGWNDTEDWRIGA